MGEVQALNILGQAIDVAVSAGAFKSSKDVAVVEHAKSVLNSYFETKADAVIDGKPKK